jgi:hypothetical protein
MNYEARRLFLGAVVLSVFLAVLRQAELAPDPGIYRDRMALLFDGQVPYVGFFFEHFPLAILPMALAWLVGGAFSSAAYTILFAVMMAMCLGLTMALVERTGVRLGTTALGLRWLALAGPLFPIVLFRSDPFPVLLAIAGLYAMVTGRERLAITMELGGILTKGWPVVLAVPEWWRGRRWRALLLMVVTLAVAGALITFPGFSQSRQFTGIHSETTVGAAFTLTRIWSGSSLELINEAGATYVAVPMWATISNLGFGVALLLVALYRLKPGFSWDASNRLMATAVVAILIAAPLLSPQFVLWPTPFLALHSNRAVRHTGIAVSALTLIYMLAWNPGFEGDMWWVGVVNLRNLVLLGLGIMCVVTVNGDDLAASSVDRGSGQSA